MSGKANDKMREKFVKEMQRLELAVKESRSPYLKNDYRKALKKMREDLAEYDKFHLEAEKNGKRTESCQGRRGA